MTIIKSLFLTFLLMTNCSAFSELPQRDQNRWQGCYSTIRQNHCTAINQDPTPCMNQILDRYVQTASGSAREGVLIENGCYHLDQSTNRHD